MKVLGSIEYRDPHASESFYSWESDVYSFAHLILAILTRKEPLSQFLSQVKELPSHKREAKLREKMRSIREGERPPIPDYVPLFWRSLIEKCWSKDLKERPNMKSIIEALEEEQMTLRYNPLEIITPDNFEELKNGVGSVPHFLPEHYFHVKTTTCLSSFEDNSKVKLLLGDTFDLLLQPTLHSSFLLQDNQNQNLFTRLDFFKDRKAFEKVYFNPFLKPNLFSIIQPLSIQTFKLVYFRSHSLFFLTAKKSDKILLEKDCIQNLASKSTTGVVREIEEGKLQVSSPHNCQFSLRVTLKIKPEHEHELGVAVEDFCKQTKEMEGYMLLSRLKWHKILFFFQTKEKRKRVIQHFLPSFFVPIQSFLSSVPNISPFNTIKVFSADHK